MSILKTTSRAGLKSNLVIADNSGIEVGDVSGSWINNSDESKLVKNEN